MNEGLTTVLAAATFIAAIFGIVMAMRASAARQQLDSAKSAADDAEKQLSGTRNELAEAKQALSSSKKKLGEAKDEAKKKARREGKKQKSQANAERQSLEADAPDVAEFKAEQKRLKQAIAGLEKQVENTQKEAKRTVADAEKIARDNIGAQIAQQKERADKLQKTLEELRASVKKQKESRPNVPGSGLDLKALPAEAVQELARYYKKGSEYERLYAVAQGQVQLERDKFADLNKRYLAVCRELAVAASADGVDDSRAKELAENVVAQSNAAPKGGRPANNAPRANDDEGGQKKKRRRRRRKKPGEGAQLSLDGAMNKGSDDQASDKRESAASDGGDKESGAKGRRPGNAASPDKAEAKSDDGAKADASSSKSDDAPAAPSVEAIGASSDDKPLAANAE